MLTETEWRQVTSLNQSAVTLREKCVQELFEEQAAKTPHAVAVVCEQQRVTYEELNSQANQLADYLRERGVGPETLVGLCLERSLDMIVGLLGVLKAGGAYVPLDPAFPAERLQYILEDAQIKLVLSQAQWRNRIPGHREILAVDQDQELWQDRASGNPTSGADGSNCVYVIYTSGSTGKPKGVVIEHRQLANYVQAISKFIQLGPGCRMAMISTFASDLGNTVLFPSLCGGGELHMISDEVARNPRAWEHYCKSRAIECMKVTPSHLESLLNINTEDRAHQNQRDRSGVPSRLVILGGEASGRKWIEKVRARGGSLCKVVNHYGPTECTVGALADWVRGKSASNANNVPIGRPLANMRVFVVDENGQLAMPGQRGELWIGGAGVARGYFGKAELTAERFVPDAYGGAGERLYRTGDLVRVLPEGKIEFLGRRDYQLKIRGFRVELQEIEAALREHTAVKASVVVAWGPSDHKQLVAYAVASNSNGRELRDFLKTKLPDYMVPASVVMLERLPLTHNGKIDRDALPPPKEQRTQSSYAAPRTPIEEVFAGIWSEALKLSRVGTDDNFFELGGNSLLAMRTLWRMQEALQLEISLYQFVKNPTIAALVRSIESTLTRSQGKAQLAPGSRPGSNRVPLSFGQERLWFLQQFDLASSVYNISYLLWLRGRLDVSALEKAVSEIVRRHQVLRTTFATADNEPVQIVNPESRLRFPQVNLADVLELERDREARMLAKRQARQPFDLIHGPLLRFLLMRMETERHVLVLSAHHIVSDGWSMDVFVQELAALYDAFSKGQPSPLPELPIQYADFADWQRRCAQDNAFDEQLAYWKQQLEGMPESLELSVARPRSPVQNNAGARHQFQVSSQVSEFIYAVSKKEGVTLFMMLLAAFQVLLSRYTGLRDVIVGTPSAGRSHAQTEGLIGFFVNMLVLRTDLSENPRLRDLLHQVQAMALQAYVNQDLPFEKLVRELRPERDSVRVPLVQVVFTLETNQRDCTMGGVALQIEEVANSTAKFDLVLSVTETGEGFRGSFEYSLDLFDAPTIERMAGHFLVLLEGATARPEQAVSDLPWLTSGELQQLVLDWNRTEVTCAQDRCVHELFEDQVEKKPEAVALMNGDQRLTYKELNQKANQLAWQLIELGVGPEIPVGICVERSPEMVVAMLGVLKAGGAYLPLDPVYPSEHLSFTLQDAGVGALLTHTKWSANLLRAGLRVVLLDQLRHTAGTKTALEKPHTAVSPDNVAYVIYTSGSTGKPKGISVTHGNLLNLVFWHQSKFGITANDRATQLASPAFDASTWELWPYLTSGASVTIVSQSTRMDPEELQKFIISNGITVTFAPTPVAEELLRLSWPTTLALRLLLTGGDRLRTPPARVLQFTLSNNYGPTENTVVATSGPIDPLEKNHCDPAIGRPISNVQAYVLDPQYRPVPIGIPGELYLGGANLTRGYQRPHLTAERFVPNPFRTENGARMYATGDLVRYRADGNLEFLGRIDQQVKIRGFRIELGEIEKVLAGHAMLRDAVVIAAEDAPGDQRLVAYIVPRTSQEPSSEELRRFIRTKLPDYMVPSYFVKLKSLPLTSNQKLDRSALPPPERMAAGANRSYVPPKTAIEEFLVDVWAKVLKVDQVSVQDDFFELGGHSLLATQVLSRIRSILKVDVPLQKLFEAPNVEELSRAVISSDKKPGQAEKIAKIYKRSLQTNTEGASGNP